jgi:hypothetical protein
MASLANVQKNRKGLQLLGAEEKPQTKKGFLSVLLDQETGILSAPARGVSAFVADALNITVPEAERIELDKGTPLQSAVRSFKGEFAVTGGDVFKVRDDDNFGTRLAKYAGALTFDIATDPINYIGPTNIFSRAGASSLAVREGENMLSTASKLLVENGQEAASLTDKLFSRSRGLAVAQEGAEQYKALLGIGEDGVVDAGLKARAAGIEFGRTIADALYKEGRTGVRKAATELLGSEELAKKFMLALPAEISGGIFIKNPLSGRAIQRIYGGVGGGGVAAEAANQLRFAAVSTAPARKLTSMFGGKSGTVLNEVKAGLRGAGIGGVGAPVMDAMQRTTFADYTMIKDFLRQKEYTLNDLGYKSAASMAKSMAISKNILDEADQKAYNAAFQTYFFSPVELVPDNATNITKLAAAAASELRADMRTTLLKAIEDGVNIRDLGEYYTPLMFTKKAYEEQAKRGMLTGLLGDTLNYSPESRRSLIEVSDDPAIQAKLGSEIVGRDGVIALNAISANKSIGEDLYETDPIKVAQMWYKYVNTAIASTRFANAAVEAGVLLKFPAQTKKMLEEIEAATFIGAAKKYSKDAAAKVNKILSASELSFKELVDEDAVKQVAKNVGQRKTEAIGAYTLAKEASNQADQVVRDAERRLVDAQRQVGDIGMMLREYGQAGVEQTEADAYRISRNAQSRLSKAGNKLEEAQAAADDIAVQLGAVGPESPQQLQSMYDLADEADQSVSAAQDKLNKEMQAVQDAKDELQSARNIRSTLEGQMTEQQRAAFGVYQNELAIYQDALAAREAATKSRQATLAEYRAANADTTILRASAVDTVVSTYVRARTEYISAKNTIGKSAFKMNDEERLMYEVARDKYKNAERIMVETLGYSTSKTDKGAGQRYAKMVVDMADRLSEAEFDAARVLGTVERLDELGESLTNVSLRTDAAMNLVGDLATTYSRIRDVLTEKELLAFTEAEQRVLSAGINNLYRDKKVVPAIATKLYSEEGISAVGVGLGKGGVKIPASLRDTYATKGVRELLERMYLAKNNPTDWDKFITKLYDPLALVWKTAATVGRGPAYVMNNLVGGMYNNYLGRVSYKSHRLSAEVLGSVTSTLQAVAKKNPNASYLEQIAMARPILEKALDGKMVRDKKAIDLFVDFLERGGHFSTDMHFQTQEFARLGIEMNAPLQRTSGIGGFEFDDEPTNIAENGYRKTIEFLLNNPVQRSFSDAAQVSEIFLRFAAFTEGYAKYGNLDSAMDLTYLLHFDYQDLSDAERWVKRLVPFYTWSRNNVPLQFRAALVATDQMRKAYSANEELKAAFGVGESEQWLNDYLPEYMVQSGGFLSYLAPGGNHLAMFGKTPMYDIDKLFQVGYIGSIPIPVPRRTELINMAGPVIKSPIEFLTGRNFEQGYEYKDDKDLLIGQSRILVPYVGTIKKALSAAGFGDQGKRWSNMWGTILGSPVGMTTFGEDQLGRMAKERSSTVSKQLTQAAAEAGVDADWLRKEIASGQNLVNITLKLASGEGSIAEVERRKRAKEIMEGPKVSKAQRGYGDVISEIRSGQ